MGATANWIARHEIRSAHRREDTRGGIVARRREVDCVARRKACQRGRRGSYGEYILHSHRRGIVGSAHRAEAGRFTGSSHGNRGVRGGSGRSARVARKASRRDGSGRSATDYCTDVGKSCADVGESGRQRGSRTRIAGCGSDENAERNSLAKKRKSGKDFCERRTGCKCRRNSRLGRLKNSAEKYSQK